MSWLKKNTLSILSLLTLGLIVYLNSLGNAFVSDDIAGIAQNPKIGDLGYIFSHPIGIIRPILYYLALKIGGLNPIPFRLINIFFHLGNILLIFALINHFAKKRVAFFTAAIFAVHPAFTEAVSWIAGGAYVQYSFFMLASLLTYIKAKNSYKLLTLSLFFYFLALMSHGAAVVLAGILFAYQLSLGSFKKDWKKLIPFILLTLVWVWIDYQIIPTRAQTLKIYHYQDQTQPDNPLVVFPIAISSYLQLLSFPLELSFYHSELRFVPVNFIIRALIFLAFLALTLYGFFKNKLLFFWLSFFLTALLPMIIPAILHLTWIVAERYVYLASLGVIFLFCFYVDKILSAHKLAKVVPIIIGVLIVLLGARTFLRNMDWYNEDALWIATGKTAPSSPNTHNNLGDMYGRHGDKLAAIREFQLAIELKPNYADAYHNLGNAYKDNGEIDKALESYQKAAEINPYLWQSYQNIAAIYFEKHQYDQSVENLQKGLKVDPQNPNLWINLGVVYFKLGDKEKAKQAFEQALSIDPTNQLAQAAIMEISK